VSSSLLSYDFFLDAFFLLELALVRCGRLRFVLVDAVPAAAVFVFLVFFAGVVDALARFAAGFAVGFELFINKYK
jgi:hypothetical protein